jgi:hypothetical protein
MSRGLFILMTFIGLTMVPQWTEANDTSNVERNATHESCENDFLRDGYGEITPENKTNVFLVFNGKKRNGTTQRFVIPKDRQCSDDYRSEKLPVRCQFCFPTSQGAWEKAFYPKGKVEITFAQPTNSYLYSTKDYQKSKDASTSSVEMRFIFQGRNLEFNCDVMRKGVSLDIHGLCSALGDMGIQLLLDKNGARDPKPQNTSPTIK